MTTFGYMLATEEHTPAELLRQAELAEQAGFEALWISDHFHPWNHERGQALTSGLWESSYSTPGTASTASSNLRPFSSRPVGGQPGSDDAKPGALAGKPVPNE